MHYAGGVTNLIRDPLTTHGSNMSIRDMRLVIVPEWTSQYEVTHVSTESPYNKQAIPREGLWASHFRAACSLSGSLVYKNISLRKRHKVRA